MASEPINSAAARSHYPLGRFQRDLRAMRGISEPKSVSVAPGGSTQSLGTIRGATRTALSAVIDVPNDVTVHVTTVATTNTVLTTKYIVFANAAAVPGTYVLMVRVTASGDQTSRPPSHSP